MKQTCISNARGQAVFLGVLASLLVCGLVPASGCSDDSGGENVDIDAARQALCGNGVKEPGEECDEGQNNSDVEPNACRTDCRFAWCGDGVADQDEECDGADLKSLWCSDIEDNSGINFTAGQLGCTADCKIDVSGCTRCGNGLSEAGEDCDGLDINGQDCASVAGKQGGQLTCRDDCTFDTSQCHTCGDGVLEEGEDCEVGLTVSETCAGLGYTFGTLACNLETCRYDTSDCHSVCGNGRSEAGEQCDGADLAGQDCTSVGLQGGDLRCSPACLYDVSGCTTCGDGVLDEDHGEECDGTDLGGKSCQDLTGQAGTLACTEDCHLDMTGCEAPSTCGNGLLDSDEQCDGANLAGETCQGLNPNVWGGGHLGCSENCTYDTSGCEPVERCGNGRLEPEYGEECDGTDLGGRHCVDLGYQSGDLACASNCTYDPSRCESGATCGNGQAEPGEQCDGTDMQGTTCTSLGFHAGSLSCTAQCTFDTAGCTTCGDDQINGPGEQCDGPDLGGKTCEDLDYYGGSLACHANCTFDLTDCRAAGFCGDGQVNGQEQCDGSDLSSQTCQALGHLSGSLSCKPDCTFDESNCSDCGNATLDPGEQCDGTNLNGQTCVTLGYQSGSLACMDYCRFDVTGCSGTATCGNGIKDPGEFCDGADLGGRTCETIGYYGGHLACKADCSGLETSDCQRYGRCGDGIWQQDYETCDRAGGGLEVCQAAGHMGGTVTCSWDCSQVAEWQCNECGNGAIDPGEECDGQNLDGKSCQTEGFPGGILVCSTNCTLDRSACWQCGNGAIDPGEECDGQNLDGQTCQDIGYLHGTLVCDPNCRFDDSDCDSCGDGILDPNEICDDGNTVDWDGCTQCHYRELLVSTPKEGADNSPKIDRIPDGRFAITWYRYRHYGRHDGSYVQRFHADGTKDGTEWLSPNADGGLYPNLALWPDGSIALARSISGTDVEVSALGWELDFVYSDSFSFRYPRLPVLVPLAQHRLAAFWSNGCSGSSKRMEVRILDASGNVLQSWSRDADSASRELGGDMCGDATALYTIHAQAAATLRLSRWTQDGTELWHNDIPVSSSQSSHHGDLAPGPDQGVWVLYRDPSDQLLLAQYNAQGNLLASTLVANNDIQRGCYHIDSGSDRRAVVVWEDTSHHIWTQIFGPDASPWTNVIQVSERETIPDIYHERRPNVSVHPVTNSFIVVYMDDLGLNWGDNIVPASIVMRGFAPDGTPLGPPPW